MAGPPSNVVVCHLMVRLNLSFTSLVKSFVARFQSAACGAKTLSVVAGFPVIVGNGLLAGSSFDPLPEQATRASARRLVPTIAARLRVLSFPDITSLTGVEVIRRWCRDQPLTAPIRIPLVK